MHRPTAPPSPMEIFNEALDRGSPAERAAYLDRACAGDPALRARVEALLAVHDRAGEFLEAPALAPTIDASPPEPAECAGTVIGPYKLLERIGEGGMGAVYVAEQVAPVRRRVALKVIKPGMDTKQVVARFEAERQALALMDHPNIARVHDAGATESGRPYFVMELVRGIPITDYCDREQLSIPERLELFVLVCRAVQHAHQKGIIHRDLKPSNILVTVIDGAAVPKVIDFGVAKATGGSLTERTVYTGFHQFVGTPLYMSPEQADLAGVDVDTRSDIYALGVLLYELLTGTTPFDRETFRKAAFDELRRIIREQEPPRPSTRLSALGASRTTVAANRRAGARHLDRAVRGELDWVVMKALEKDRKLRYETANDFAADVMRYLCDEPVEACPPSARYRFGKFVRRNRAAITTAGLVAAALVVGTAVSLWQARRAREAAAEAAQRADESRQVVDYLVRDVFGAAAPGKPRDRSMTVGELLDHADASVGARFRRQPLVEASVRMALSQSYRTLWDQKRAEPHAARAVELRSRLLGPEHPETLEGLREQASVLLDAGWKDRSRWEAATAIARRVLAGRRRVLGPAHPETLEVQSFLAYLLLRLGRLDEALAEAGRAEALALHTLGPDHPRTLGVWDATGQIVAARGDRERGAALLRRVAAGRERLLGPLDPETIGAVQNLADLLREDGQLPEARRLYLDAIDRTGRVYGLTHVACSSPMYELIDVLRRQGEAAALRDACQGWLRDILATPAGADPYLRYRRSLRLSHTALDLATLPEPIPFDADLAIRAAQEAVALVGPRDNAWQELAVVSYRTGRFDAAMQAIRKSIAWEEWKRKSPAAAQDGPTAAQPGLASSYDFDQLMLALIHARRGEMDRARAWYDKVGKRPEPGSRRGAFLQLLGEAEALIDARPPRR